jgi:hypothetical protein
MRDQGQRPADEHRERHDVPDHGPIRSQHIDVRAAWGRAPLTAETLLALQRSIGNRAVVRLLEQRRRANEADSVLDDADGQPALATPVQRSTVPDVLRSSGRPIEAPLRAEMETRLGADFAEVRMHDDAAAARSAAEVGARAYTSGNHVVIGAGGADKHTLAHELTHVIQQRQGPVAGTDDGSGLRVSDPADRFERAAEANARRALASPAPTRSPCVGHVGQSEAGNADAETIQRADNPSRNSPYGTYRTEEFSYTPTGAGDAQKRERVTKAWAVVKTRIKREGATPPPLSFTGPGGSDSNLGWQRGHVIALEATGDNESYNIVPMLPGFNHGGEWREVERLARKTAAQTKDSRVLYQVTVYYSSTGFDARVPVGFETELFAQEGDKWVPISGTKRTLRHEAKVTPAPTAAEKAALLKTPASLDIKHFGKFAQDPKEAATAVKAGHLPTSRNVLWPDKFTDRPYEILDLQAFANEDASISSHAVFSREQREKILKLNMARNGGVLKSDDPSDPHQILDENGAANYPEIDHIIPKSVGGSNAFSNARVISWQLNNKEDRVKNIGKLVDLKRTAYITNSSLRVAIWEVVLRHCGDGKGINEEEIKLGVRRESGYQGGDRGFDAKVKVALEDLVANGCLELSSGTYAPGDEDAIELFG